MLHRHAQQMGHIARREFERRSEKMPFAVERTTFHQWVSEGWAEMSPAARCIIITNVAFWGVALAIKEWF